VRNNQNYARSVTLLHLKQDYIQYQLIHYRLTVMQYYSLFMLLLGIAKCASSQLICRHQLAWLNNH
jgi:hypothetical protein